MKRDYDAGLLKNVNVFTGIEVEKTKHHGLKTLFIDIDVDGFVNLQEIYRKEKCTHVYVGANKSIKNRKEFMKAMVIAWQVSLYCDKITVDLPYEFYKKNTVQLNDDYHYIISIDMPDRRKNMSYKIDCKGFFEDIDNVIVVNETDESLKTFKKEYGEDKVINV